MLLLPVLPRILNLQLNRAVEAIVLKYLEKDPQRRYETAGRLAGDRARNLSPAN
jgi:hypothetical protein